MNVLSDIFGNSPVMSMGNYEFQEAGNEIFQSGLNQIMNVTSLIYAGLIAIILILDLVTRK